MESRYKINIVRKQFNFQSIIIYEFATVEEQRQRLVFITTHLSPRASPYTVD